MAVEHNGVTTTATRGLDSCFKAPRVKLLFVDRSRVDVWNGGCNEFEGDALNDRERERPNRSFEGRRSISVFFC